MKAFIICFFFVVLALCEPTGVLLKNAAVPGLIMPAVGLGTGGYGTLGNVGGEYWYDAVAQKAVVSWIAAGGIRIDNSNDYNTMNGVGAGIAQSGKPRESLFITSKVGFRLPLGYNETIQQTNDILTALRTNYVDLLLIHWPGAPTPTGINWPCYQNAKSFKNCRQETWRALEDVFRAGKARAIGVSNFEVKHLEDIFELNSLIPSVNQNEYHPYFHEDALVLYCKDRNIVYNGYSSVGCPDFMSSPPTAWKVQVIQQPIIEQIAQKYNKTAAQVVLRWSWQQGLVVNARSWSPVHHMENLNNFDFTLTMDEISNIGAVPKPQNPKVCLNPSVIA